MDVCSLRFGFLSTYNSTVFVKRAADTSFLLSPPIKHDTVQPSLRQIFAGFCLMALSEPKYFPGPGFKLKDVSISRVTIRDMVYALMYREATRASS